MVCAGCGRARGLEQHVVRGAKAAKVTLFNNEQFDCIVKGAEPDKDLALLQVVGRKWPWRPVTVGSSSSLQVLPGPEEGQFSGF